MFVKDLVPGRRGGISLQISVVDCSTDNGNGSKMETVISVMRSHRQSQFSEQWRMARAHSIATADSRLFKSLG